MKKRYYSAVFAAVFSAAMFVSANAGAVELTSEEKAALAAGKSVKKPLPESGHKGFYGGSGFTLIDAPVDVVWQAILDWSAYPSMFPKTLSVEEVAQKGNQSLLHIKMGHKLISLEYHVNVSTDISKYMISFELVTDRPHDLDATRGYWRLFPQKDGRTLVAYVVAARVPMGVVSIIPQDLEKKIERNLIGAPNDLKKWIMSPKGQKYFTRTAAR